MEKAKVCGAPSLGHWSSQSGPQPLEDLKLTLFSKVKQNCWSTNLLVGPTEQGQMWLKEIPFTFSCFACYNTGSTRLYLHHLHGPDTGDQHSRTCTTSTALTLLTNTPGCTCTASIALTLLTNTPGHAPPPWL